MRIAYLIITHSMPDHLGRQIRALSDEQSDFFVHVNQQFAIEPFQVHRAPNVHFLDQRMTLYWGEWQIVETTINLIRGVLNINGRGCAASGRKIIHPGKTGRSVAIGQKRQNHRRLGDS